MGNNNNGDRLTRGGECRSGIPRVGQPAPEPPTVPLSPQSDASIVGSVSRRSIDRRAYQWARNWREADVIGETMPPPPLKHESAPNSN
ncbi:unnamed protein product, partial [Iphiclides podalirius]